jgi:hypothetical protein
MTKAIALAKGYELDTLLQKARDDVLRVLFGGGVIRGKKLQRGSVFTFAEIDTTSSQSMPDAEQISCMYENMNLLQRVFPTETLIQKVKERRLKNSIK